MPGIFGVSLGAQGAVASGGRSTVKEVPQPNWPLSLEAFTVACAELPARSAILAVRPAAHSTREHSTTLKTFAIAALTASLLACGGTGGMDAGTGGGSGGSMGDLDGGTGGGSGGGAGGGQGGTDAGTDGVDGGTSDTTPPQITGSVPSSGATNVAVATAIQVTFSEPMDTNTVTAALSPSIPLGGPSWSAGQTQLSLSPVVSLALATDYTLTVTGSDIAGNDLPPVSITFRTAASSDTTPPTVASTAPASASTGIATSVPVVITFSERMNTGSVAVTASPPVTFGTPAWTLNDRVVTLAANPALATSTTYTFSVTGSDVAGNSLASAHTFSFTTAAPPDLTPPALAGSTPTSGATDVPSTTRLALTFSEAMNTGSVGVTSSPALDLGAASWSNADKTVTFPSPAADWAAGTSYTVTVAGTDVAGNALGTTTVTFTTYAPPDTTPPVVQATTPAAGATGVAHSTKIQLVFSEPMRTAETEAALSTTPPVTCAFAWSTGDSVLECTPSAPLAYTTQHTVTVGTGAKDKNDNALASDYSFSFTTAGAPDTTAPTIVSTVPPTFVGPSPGIPGVMNLAADGGILFDHITVTFSEPMNQAAVQGSFTLNDDKPSTTLTGGTFSWSTDGTEMTYLLPQGALPMPWGTIVNFSVGSAATDLANNPLAAPSAGLRHFQLRQRATFDLYSCGASATSTCNAANPSAPSGYISGPDGNTCGPTNTTTTQSGIILGHVGDLQDNVSIYRTYLTFSLLPLAQRPYDNNLAIISAEANVYQATCNNSPYKPSEGRVATLYDINYGTTLENADCALTPGNGVSLTDSTSAGFKTADVTDIVKAHWADRGVRGHLSQFLLRLPTGPSLNSQADSCMFYLWGYNTASQRPYVKATVEYN